MSFYAQQSNEHGDSIVHLHEAELDGAGATNHDSQQESEQKKLIVNYLPQSLTDEQLCTLFSKIGPVVSAKIIRDLNTNYSYGYGFVEMSCFEDADAAVKQLKGHQIQNKRLGVAFARAYDKDTLKNTNLYVSSIPSSHISEDAIKDLFAQYGKIINVKVLSNDRSNQSRGSAFVRFDRREEAEEAIKGLDGHQIDGCFEPLVVKVSEEHGKQKANHFAGYVNSHQNQYYHQQSSHGGYHQGYQGSESNEGGHRGGRWNGGGGHYEQRRGGGQRGGGGYYGGGGNQRGGDYFYGGGSQWN